MDTGCNFNEDCNNDFGFCMKGKIFYLSKFHGLKNKTTNITISIGKDGPGMCVCKNMRPNYPACSQFQGTRCKEDCKG